MSPDVAPDICTAFDLGEALAEPVRVAGGWTHRLWRLTTDRGVFAVKEIGIDPGGTWQAPWIERAFGVERAAYEAGVPMPRPVPVAASGTCLAETVSSDGETIVARAHEWVEGDGLHHTVYPADVSETVARVIARIHALNLPASETLAEALLVGGEEHWLSLAERVERSDIEWRWEFRGLLPTISELEAYVVFARTDTTPLIMSHRDADQKNWMRTPAGELLLVDWDAAGRVHPRHEVAALALRWGGVGLGEPDWRIVRAWINAYRDAGGELDRIRPGDLGEFISVAIWWFEFNVRRALGGQGRGGDDRKRGEDFARREFKSLPRTLRSIERWERVLGEP
jgi:thiamine kinase-like enzyme